MPQQCQLAFFFLAPLKPIVLCEQARDTVAVSPTCAAWNRSPHAHTSSKTHRPCTLEHHCIVGAMRHLAQEHRQTAHRPQSKPNCYAPRGAHERWLSARTWNSS